MDYKTIKPFDSRTDEEKDWRQQLREESLRMSKGISRPGEVKKPGFTLTTASGEAQQPAAEPPASGSDPTGDAVERAQQMLEENIAQSSGSGVPSWHDQLDETLAQILNRKDFSYDLNGDALYQQYKDQYMLQGQQAMMDTMGQAAAMTGGYGNSYAQTVGQQAYNSHLQQLGSRIPELYSLALSKYQNEGDALLDRYAILKAERDYEEEHKGGSGGGGGGSLGVDTPEDVEQPEETEEPKPSTPNYGTVAHNVNQYIKNGASQKEIDAYLRSAYNAGYITYEQYVSLKNGYRPVDFGE